MKRVLVIIGGLASILVVVLLFNTLRFSSKQKFVAALTTPPASAGALDHLKQAVAYKTISFADSSQFDSAQFNAFHRFLKSSYPKAHQILSLEKLAGYSLLYKWEGKNPQLNPFVLMAHQDVVPIEEASRSSWTTDPFVATIKDGFIQGRGTADDKINLIAIIEAVEKLVNENFQPERTIYLAFGHDEEIGGRGARAIAAYLIERKIVADLVLDEGGIVTADKVPGMTRPVALIGTSEKGYLSLELTVEKNGGHSSMPEKETALDILSKAIVAIRAHPFEARFSPSTEGFLAHVGPEMPYPEKIVFANTWLFRSVVIGIYEKSPGGNALVRTTAVPTIYNAGMKDNVVPSRASAVVNFRLLPGDSSEFVLRWVREVIGDDRVTIRTTHEFYAEASAVSPEDGFGFLFISNVVHLTQDQTITAPFLMIGGTDSRHLEGVSKNIIKFSPMTDPIGFHGIDERVSLQSYANTLWFFEQLLRMNNTTIAGAN